MNQKQIIILYKGEEYTARLPEENFGKTAYLTGKKKSWYVVSLQVDGTATLGCSSKTLGPCRWRVEGAPASDAGYGINDPQVKGSMVELAEFHCGLYARMKALGG